MVTEKWVKNTGIMPEGITDQTKFKLIYDQPETFIKHFYEGFGDQLFWDIKGDDDDIAFYCICED